MKFMPVEFEFISDTEKESAWGGFRIMGVGID
jgi:hypothetical protein